MQNNKDVVEIDLLELFNELKNNALVIIAITVICGALTFGYSRLFLIPQYESVSSLFILTKETTLTSLADLQIGAQLTNDYKVIITSRPVLQDVVNELDLDIDYKTLKTRLVIDNPDKTRILTITIQDSDPELAKLIVDTVAETSSGYIADAMEMEPPKIIETGEVATEKCAPSNGKNAVIGAIVGFVLVCTFYCIRFIRNDVITTPEDVEKYLGISVLASIPVREGSKNESDDKASYRHKKPLSHFGRIGQVKVFEGTSRKKKKVGSRLGRRSK